MTSVHDVAAALLDRLGEMTAMRLEKLVYYCQCWHLARHDLRLFPEPIEAWREGPVVPALFRHHKQLYRVREWPGGEPARLEPAERESIDWVVERYGGFSAVQLSRMTHSELPWRLARGGLPDRERSNSEIRPDIMTTYYGRQRADAETAVTLAAASAALEGVELDEDWQDRLRDVASGAVTADALVAEEIARLDGG